MRERESDIDESIVSRLAYDLGMNVVRKGRLMWSPSRNFKHWVHVALIAGVLGGASAHAQQNAPPDAALDAARRAFEALPETDRRAIQDGLIWTGDYKGVVDGRFGKGTRDAIATFALRQHMPGDGTLDAKGRAVLAAVAQVGKQAVGFGLVLDERTGIKIGLPLKLLAKTGITKSGTTFGSRDGAAVLETMLRPDEADGLASVFDELRSDAPGRKVTYKILRPDFLVVAGETRSAIFYTRYAHGVRNGADALAGFTFSYAAGSKAVYDKLAIAIANSFEPFANVLPPAPGSPVPAAPAAASAPMSTPQPASLVASGVSFGKGLVVTSLPAGCNDPSIGGRRAKILRQDGQVGLSLLEVASLTAPVLLPRPGALSAEADVVVLGYAGIAGSGAADELVAAPGDIRIVAGKPKLSAAVAGPAAGSAVLDRGGALIGLLPAEAAAAKLFAGLSPRANYRLVDQAALAEFTGLAAAPSGVVPAKTIGELTARAGASIVAIRCTAVGQEEASGASK